MKVFFVGFSKITSYNVYSGSLGSDESYQLQLPAGRLTSDMTSLYVPRGTEFVSKGQTMTFLWTLTFPALARLFQPVQYGQKPEGRTVVFPSTQVQRTVTTATVTQQGQVRGRSPIATVSSNQGKGLSATLLTCTSA